EDVSVENEEIIVDLDFQLDDEDSSEQTLVAVDQLEQVSLDSSEQDIIQQEDAAQENTEFVAETNADAMTSDESPSDDIAVDDKVVDGSAVDSDALNSNAAEDDDENYIDDEIIEIFVEEAGEVLEAIAQYFPRWAKNFDDENSLTEFRRAFHTLKGSGRMVGANDVGELSWSIENMLNRVIDNTIQPGEPHVAIIEKVRVILPAMVEAFSHKLSNPHPQLSQHYRELAESLAKGVVPEELLSGSATEVVNITEPTTEILGNDSVDELENSDDTNAKILDDNDAVQSVEHRVEDAQAEEPNEDIVSVDAVAAADESHAYAESNYPVAGSNDYLIDENGDDSDAQLWDIFGAEALTHLQTLQEFISHMEAEAPVYEPPSDSIQRALHTLKGSAHMAEITPIAELAAPLEKFVKELRSYHVVINDDILQLLRDAVSYTEAGLAQIERGEEVEIPRLQQFTARVHELREIHVAPLVRQQELDENGKRPVDPELLSIFMAEEMNLLLDADKIIAQWQSAPEDVAILQPVLDELRNLNRGAHHAYLPVMANLGEKLEHVYIHIVARRLVCSDSLCRDINSAHIALLDMVDAIAAGQNLMNAPESIVQALDELIAQAQASNEIDFNSSVAEELRVADTESIAENDEQHRVESQAPLIEEVDYEEIALSEQTSTLELAEEDALQAANNVLADTPVVERIAADVADEDHAFTSLEDTSDAGSDDSL
ncbi:MAG: histidine kinase, partial [Moraxellaceae bacterium]